jgi:hypothetical protein
MTANRTLRRIHVVGGEATGKTTISRAIGARLGAPVVNTDGIAWEVVGEAPFSVWEPGYQPSAPIVQRPLEERLAMVEEVVRQPTWVSEGKHLWWTEQLFAQADAILFLDHVPARVATFRILRRAMRSAIREARRQKGLKKFARFGDYARHSAELARQLWNRLRYVNTKEAAPEPSDEFSAITRAATLAVLARYEEKVVHCRTLADLEAFVEQLPISPPEHRGTETRDHTGADLARNGGAGPGEDAAPGKNAQARGGRLEGVAARSRESIDR